MTEKLLCKNCGHRIVHWENREEVNKILGTEELNYSHQWAHKCFEKGCDCNKPEPK